MRIVTVSFNYPQRLKRPDYHRLLEVFERSVRHNMPKCEFRSIVIDPPDHEGAVKIPFLSNTFKLAIWVEEAHAALADNENLILADCDMLCTGDAGAAFEQDFDIGYTVRDDHTNIPMNGGIVFVKPTFAAARFMTQWGEVDRRMYSDWNFHQPWRIKYAGQNQASFGYLLENPVSGVNMREFQTRVWNAVNTDWNRLTTETVFIHIKSQLRKAVLRGEPPNGPLRPAMMKWYEERDRKEVTA